MEVSFPHCECTNDFLILGTKTVLILSSEIEISMNEKVINQSVEAGDMLDNVRSRIVEVRGQDVLLDSDVAELYGVETKRVNEAVRNNLEKFPERYMFRLNRQELIDLRSKFSTANLSSKSRVAPAAFTERGLYMLATILKSRRAVEATFAIIETFASVRDLKRNLKELHEEVEPMRKNELMKRFGDALSDIVMPDLETSETESSLELNFFLGKLKHTVKRIKKRN